MENRNIEVMDIETFAAVFTYTGLNIDTLKLSKFVIHKDKNQLVEFVEHIKSLNGQIGFNTLNFDYPVIHYILKNWESWSKLSPTDIIALIYKKAQSIIDDQSKSTFSTTMIRPKDVIIPQMDLFRMWHYNNPARSTSLKALEIGMNYPNVMESEIHHSKESLTLEEVDSVLDYNENDVMATYEFFKKSKDKIELRKTIEAKYGIKCINWNNGKIGEELILKLYCDKTGLNPWDVKVMRSNRPEIALKDCIPSTIVFESNEFYSLKAFFESKVITETKGSVDYSMIYKGLKYYYGTGGVHASVKAGVYESDDKYVIETIDVQSLYPNIPITIGFTIGHLGKEFLDVYENDIVGVRLAEKAKPKAEWDKAIVDGYKEAANIPYGKSNDANSYLYDPLYSMKTTIAGQLVISMLAERLANIFGSQILMVNTDGLEIRILRSDVSKFREICKQWEKETKLILEYGEYQKMVIGDINNYIAIDMKGKPKNKGRFEVDKVIGGEPAYHKDNSFRIIPLAIQEFFVKGTPVEDTIKNHFTNTYLSNANHGVYDFCGRQKFKGQDYGVTHILDYKNGLSYDRVEKQQKNVRYYVTSKGSTFIKHYSKGSTEVINKGYQVQIFNKYENKENYNINYDFYIKQAYREIDTIIDKQLNLF